MSCEQERQGNCEERKTVYGDMPLGTWSQYLGRYKDIDERTGNIRTDRDGNEIYLISSEWYNTEIYPPELIERVYGNGWSGAQHYWIRTQDTKPNRFIESIKTLFYTVKIE